MIALYAASAFAGARFAVSGGVEALAGDPYIRAHGARIGVTLAPSELVEVGVSGVAYPALGDGPCGRPTWTELTCELLEQDIWIYTSRVTSQGQLTLRMLPLRARMGEWWTAVGVLAGVGVIGTEDDDRFLGSDLAVQVWEQVHPTAVAGWLGEVREEHLGLRARMDYVSYVEVVNVYSLERRSHLFAGAELMWWF